MPPDGEAVQVTVWLVKAELGETEQEAESADPFTLTVTLSDTDPPGPEQLSEYVLEDVSEPVD